MYNDGKITLTGRHGVTRMEGGVQTSLKKVWVQCAGWWRTWLLWGSELIRSNWANSNSPMGCEPRLRVRSAEGAEEVPPWGGGCGHTVSATRVAGR